MDSIFEEDADEVGGEIEAYCPSPRCKADTTHTIISMYEDEVRRVQCVVCGEVHAYRKPRGDGTDSDEHGGNAKHKKTMTWEDAMARATEGDLANTRPYSIRDTYEEGDVVLHPTFDIGFVVEQLPDNCVAMVFRGVPEPKKFIHNRGVEYAARMPEISEIPVPREVKKKKRAKKQDAAPQQVPARSKAQIEEAITRARGAAQARLDEAQRSADERNKKLKADAKKSKPTAKAAKPAKPVKAKAAKPVKAKAAKPVKAKPVKKPAKAKAKAKPAKAKAKAKPAKAKAKAPAKKAKKRK